MMSDVKPINDIEFWTTGTVLPDMKTLAGRWQLPQRCTSTHL